MVYMTYDKPTKLFEKTTFGNNVDLSDLHVDISDLYVDFSDVISTSLIILLLSVWH